MLDTRRKLNFDRSVQDVLEKQNLIFNAVDSIFSTLSLG